MASDREKELERERARANRARAAERKAAVDRDKALEERKELENELQLIDDTQLYAQFLAQVGQSQGDSDLGLVADAGASALAAGSVGGPVAAAAAFGVTLGTSLLSRGKKRREQRRREEYERQRIRKAIRKNLLSQLNAAAKRVKAGEGRLKKIQEGTAVSSRNTMKDREYSQLMGYVSRSNANKSQAYRINQANATKLRAAAVIQGAEAAVLARLHQFGEAKELIKKERKAVRKDDFSLDYIRSAESLLEQV